MDDAAHDRADGGVQDRSKKSLEAAVLEAASTRQTDHPRWKMILLAEQINRRSGGALVAPWELEQLPDEWLDAYQIIIRGAPNPKYRNPLENLFVAARRKHPTYRKYLS